MCVECNLTVCAECAFNSTNCSTCSTNVNDTLYLYAYSTDYSSCLLACPNSTFANASNLTCDDCPVGCADCTASDNCSSCLANYSMLNDLCLAACPTAYFSNNS